MNCASKKRRALSVTWTQILPPTELSDSQEDVASQFAQLDLHACVGGATAENAPLHGNSPRRRRRTGRVEGDESEENERSNGNQRIQSTRDEYDDEDDDGEQRRDKSDDVDVRELDFCFDQISLNKPTSSTRRTFMPYIS
jgi:hypothetical protein